ncbi:S8 family serine peptidase [Haloarcula amylovorans]|uniref:S8 family serine peptidase n=1 Tax=Haloarcula amylovorans TaxID=2562280 RepID=UPI00142F48C5|nr:S8 family serine peptidase [Halomicroarcula amylolytica]
MSPVALAASDEPIAPGIEDNQEWFQGYQVPDDAVKHGSGTPTWIVTVSDNDTSALSAWTNESESRSLLSKMDENQAVIAASPGDMGLTFWAGLRNNGLAHQAYVTRISPNRYLSMTEPVPTSSVPTAENATVPDDYGTFRQFRKDWPDSGIAYRDSMNVTTAGEAREVIGSDNLSADGSGLTVAVVDTEFNTANGTLGLEDNVLNASKDFTESNSTYEDTVEKNGLDAIRSGNGHGSWVGSTIVNDPNSSVSDEEYEGVAPGADVLALRVLGEDGSGSTADIAAAIRYAEAHGADVISLSLGSQLYTAEVAQALDDACAGNTTIATVAAGNARESGSPYLASPADAPTGCVVAVAATNTTAPSNAGVASFSQLGSDAGADLSGGVTRGQDVDVSAPGMLIEQRVATQYGTTDKVVLSGTSMAQPFVAGSALQLLDARPELVNDTAGTREALTSTTRTMPNAAVVESGQGMVAVDRAVEDNSTGQSQSEAMDDDAKFRNTFWENVGGDGFIDQIAKAIGA